MWLISITTNTVGSHGKWTERRRGCCLTCKCPWYILSTESVADLSVSGSLDFFQTCRGRESQTGRVGVGRSCGSRVVRWALEVRRSRQSGAVLSSGAEADTLRSSRISVRGVTPRRAERRTSATSDVGRHFERIPHSVCAADAGFEQVRVAIY